MSKRTDAKDLKKKAYQRRLADRQDREIILLMEKFGFGKLFENIPEAAKATIRARKRLEVEVVRGPSLEGDSRGDKLLAVVGDAVLKGRLSDPRIELTPLKDLLTFLTCGMDACRALGADPLEIPEHGYPHPPGPSGEFTAAFARFRHEQFADLLGQLWVPEILWPLSTVSLPGETTYWVSEKVSDGPRATFTIERVRPEPLTVTIDGIPRPTWPCLSTREPGKAPEPVRWHSHQVGLTGEHTLPVHVQSHATDNWRKRLPPILIHPMMLEYYLAHPIITDARSGSGLLAYGEGPHRFGYFTFQVAQGVIVLTTFLFLTMKGTPEYRLLRDRLGLQREDIEYHRLDCAEKYFCSDLQLDTDLAKRFSECGLGHLLRPAPEMGPIIRDNFAAELRKYLRLSSG